MKFGENMMKGSQYVRRQKNHEKSIMTMTVPSNNSLAKFKRKKCPVFVATSSKSLHNYFK